MYARFDIFMLTLAPIVIIIVTVTIAIAVARRHAPCPGCYRVITRAYRLTKWNDLRVEIDAGVAF